VFAGLFFGARDALSISLEEKTCGEVRAQGDTVEAAKTDVAAAE